MGLIDWLRGGRPSTPDAQEERVETMKDGGVADEPQPAETAEERAQLEHDEEAARHRGM